MNLPPDFDGQNDDRASWAHYAVDAFADITNMRQAGEENHTIIEDLLCDLMHWCDRNKVDFHQALFTAREHYFEETKEPE